MNIIIIGIMIAAIILFYAISKKGTSEMKRPNRIKSFVTNIPAEKAMKAIIQFAQTNGYKVDDFNETNLIIILSDSASLTSYGNFYPIYLEKGLNDTVQIEVGIKMKAGGMIGLDASHERCFNGIKAAIYNLS